MRSVGLVRLDYRTSRLEKPNLESPRGQGRQGCKKGGKVIGNDIYFELYKREGRRI